MNKLSELSKPVAYKFDQLKAKKPADTKTRAAEAAGYVTDDNSGGYYVVECQECGEVYPSQECDGGGQIADSGDYNDALCPHCGCESPDECNDTPLVWNVQQAKINALLAELEAKDKRIAELELDELAMRASSRAVHEAQENHINQQQDRIDSLEKTNAGLGRGLAAAEKQLATPVRLPELCGDGENDNEYTEGLNDGINQSAKAIRAAGFTVEGDE